MRRAPVNIYRGVACIFRGVRTIKNVPRVPKARAAEGSGGLFRARKCHFPRFPRNSFINKNMKKRRVFGNLHRLYVNLLLTEGLMRDLHRAKFTGKGQDRKIRYLLCSYVCEHVEEDSLSSVMVLFILRKLCSR